MVVYINLSWFAIKQDSGHSMKMEMDIEMGLEAVKDLWEVISVSEEWESLNVWIKFATKF